MIKQRASFITLIEILFVILILSVVAGFLGININKAVREQRFRTEVSQVLERLRLAQNLMIITGADVQVVFETEKTENGIRYWIEMEEQLLDKWTQVILQPPPPLQTVHVVQFEDTFTEGKKGRLTVRFMSKGFVMSRGFIRLATAESYEALGLLQRFICLSGYPHPIVSVSEPEQKDFCLGEVEHEFNERLSAFTKEEIATKDPNYAK